MDKKLGLIVILNVFRRREEGLYLQRLLQGIASPFGIEVLISYDDGTLKIWKNFQNALTAGSNTGTHRLIIHDDVVFDRTFLEKTIHILNYLPSNSYLSLFNPDNKEYKMSVATGKRILKTTSNFWLPATIYEDNEAKTFLEWQSKYIKDEFPDGDDLRLHFYLQENGKFNYSVCPGLFQHIGAYRSNFKQGGKIGKNARWSATYNPSQNVLFCEWDEEFKNPFLSKIKYDYNKFATDQYFKDYVGR